MSNHLKMNAGKTKACVAVKCNLLWTHRNDGKLHGSHCTCQVGVKQEQHEKGLGQPKVSKRLRYQKGTKV